jgi:hypothetical protein
MYSDHTYRRGYIQRPRRLRGYIQGSHYLECAPCAWLPVHGSLCMAPCAWLPVHGSLCMAPCAWLPAHGSLCMAPCAWLPVHGSLCMAPCAWLPVHGSLRMAHCAWLPVHGSLCMAACGVRVHSRSCSHVCCTCSHIPLHKSRPCNEARPCALLRTPPQRVRSAVHGRMAAGRSIGPAGGGSRGRIGRDLCRRARKACMCTRRRSTGPL